MRKTFLLTAALLAMGCFAGCSATLTAGGQPAQPAPLATTAVTIGADVATGELLKGVKSADRAQAAQVISDLGKAIQAAAGDPADFAALNSLAAKRLTAWNSPYAPLVLALAQQTLADAESQSANQPQAVKAFVRAAGLGMQLGAQGFITP